MDILDPAAIIRAIFDGELSRAVALAAVLAYGAKQLKPYLPTGSASVPRDATGAPTEPIENRWVPLVVLALNILLNPLVAWLVNIQQGTTQSVLVSAVYGVVLGFASVGASRAIKLTKKGDVAEQKVTALRQIVKAQEPIVRAGTGPGQPASPVPGEHAVPDEPDIH